MDNRERDAAIGLRSISKSYGEKKVLDNISLTVRRGEAVALTGESGCGKTTLLRIIAGLETADGGRLSLEGKEALALAPHRRNLAMVFQEATLWNHMTVYRNIAYGMKQKNKQAVQELAASLKIDGLLDRYPGEISGGQAKRVSLARAFASDRDIFLLDEPLSNLDDGTREMVLQFIRERYVGKKTMIYVTHDHKEADMLGCLKYEMREGKLVLGDQVRG